MSTSGILGFLLQKRIEKIIRMPTTAVTDEIYFHALLLFGAGVGETDPGFLDGQGISSVGQVC